MPRAILDETFLFLASCCVAHFPKPLVFRSWKLVTIQGVASFSTYFKEARYFARHGELRCVRLAVRLKQGLRSALIAFRRPVNARAAFTRIQGAEVEGNLLRCELRADPVRAAGNEPPTAGGMPAAAPGQDTGAQVFAKEGHASLRPNGVSCKRKADGAPPPSPPTVQKFCRSTATPTPTRTTTTTTCSVWHGSNGIAAWASGFGIILW
ncbi:unnamed protein product [Polarella glacialis]|uniref:RRM domain-containing protein n=1 Tax=Polarella glacialis TaxID=89957 RepID=A0A813J9A2_POLGL|nr:unnamed protein product [Polarella glacialis]